MSNKVPGQSEKWDDVIRQLTSVWTPESAARVLAAIAQLDLQGGSNEGDVITKVGDKFVPHPASGGGSAPEIVLYASLDAINSTTRHVCTMALSGDAECTPAGVPVGDWSVNESGDLVAPEDGLYLATCFVTAVQDADAPITVIVDMNSGSSTFLVGTAYCYLPMVPAGGTARPVTGVAVAFSQAVSGPDRSLGALRVQHQEAASDAALLTVLVVLRKIG